MNNSLLVDGVDIRLLTDEELQDRLQGFGFNPGPILESTREVYQRKLARLMKNEEYEDLEGENELPIEGNYPESPILSSSFESSSSSFLNTEDLRRRPLSRVEGEKWSDDSNLSPHKAWSPDDIVTQVEPPPEEEKQSFLSSTTIAIAIVAILVFIYVIYNNMESTPQSPFS